MTLEMVHTGGEKTLMVPLKAQMVAPCLHRAHEGAQRRCTPLSQGTCIQLTSTLFPVISPAELHWEDGGVLSLWSIPGSYHDRQEDW